MRDISTYKHSTLRVVERGAFALPQSLRFTGGYSHSVLRIVSGINTSLPDIIQDDLADIVKTFSCSQFSRNNKKIILFGSFANKTWQPDSDIDIAVVVKNKPEKKQLADYYMLTDHVKRTTDLLFCTEEQLLSGKYVYGEILHKGVTIYENV
jgi:predicted nucleotidyltransferase